MTLRRHNSFRPGQSGILVLVPAIIWPTSSP
jgi:hypothetical protein